MSFNFLAAVTICSEFGAQENKVSDCFHCFLMKVKEESEKIGLRFTIQKAKIMASDPISSWQIDGKQGKQ